LDLNPKNKAKYIFGGFKSQKDIFMLIPKYNLLDFNPKSKYILGGFKSPKNVFGFE